MLFSIVIPTKDRPEYLSSCLKSLHDQTALCDNLEIIVVDDGSDNQNADVNHFSCNKYGAKYIKHDLNRGMAVARNTGLTQSKGTWLVFLDDDVHVMDNWFKNLIISTNSVSNDVVGVEGKVIPSGNGVWDREVSNLTGKAFLTCHFIVRSEVLKRIGGFDSRFEFEGPFCEDHELAARLLMQGNILFDERISVTHLPRKISLKKYLFNAPSRIRKMLNAEFYFYTKHPDRYHCFRFSKTFLGTYCSVIFKQFVNDLRRRNPSVLFIHPLQSITLTTACLIEQLRALTLLPHFLNRSANEKIGLIKHIDLDKTCRLWKFDSAWDVDFLRKKQSIIRWFSFKYFHKRPNITKIMDILRDKSRLNECRLFLRIDDVFLNRRKSLNEFYNIMAERKIPFLASVTGEDLIAKENRGEISQLVESGAVLGLHGFTHRGHFGPYPSELMQMSYPEFERHYKNVISSESVKKFSLPVLVPPFNGIGPDQIETFSQIFSVICGGPETLRFSNRFVGPVFLKNGGCFFPSLFPYYSPARKLISHKIQNSIIKNKGFICITLHFTIEEKDDFKSFRKLLDIIPVQFTPWDFFSKFI